MTLSTANTCVDKDVIISAKNTEGAVAPELITLNDDNEPILI